MSVVVVVVVVVSGCFGKEFDVIKVGFSWRFIYVVGVLWGVRFK